MSAGEARVKSWVAVAAVAACLAVGADARPLHITLTVVKSGTGSGTVRSAPAYIDCGNTCAAVIPTASEVGGGPITLKATPDPGSVFTSWTGPCEGPALTCTLELEDSTTVGAVFDRTGTQTSFALAVGKTGEGTVTSTPVGISCGPTCSASFATGTSVSLTATPASGWSFAGWTGACSGSGSCTVTMDAAKSVTANFVQTAAQSFALAVGKTGNGTVTSSPAGISCGPTCSATFPSGSTVILTAAPGPGSTFTGWSGACSGSAPTCTITMDAPRTASAVFDAATATTFPLAVSTTGSGTVTSAPAGIACGATCSSSFASGAAVTLTPAPAPGWTFVGWSGACTGAGPCTITMDAPKSVAATFQETAAQSFPLAVGLTGSGSVTSNPPGINCGTACTTIFPGGTSVTLTAAPASGFTFAAWSGACSGSRPICVVTVDSAKSVTALFRNTQDRIAPTVRALASSGKRGAVARLRYRVSDNSGRARENVTVLRGNRRIAVIRGRLDAAETDVLYYYASWKVPRRTAKGRMRFCVRAFDGAGNASRQSCAPLRIT
jgi:uncharacterized repeat protein (TIGR02543 family)